MVGGLLWDVMKDTIKIKIPKFYFSKKIKGNMVGIRTFENGTLNELDSFFPRPLSTRALLATMAKVYDSTGMLSPLKS